MTRLPDTARDIVIQAMCALREAFTPESEYPPLGGGSSRVHGFAGDAAPLAAWDAFRDDTECADPFLWVRLMRRYRTTSFPAPYVGSDPCPKPAAVAVEIGVGRCAAISMESPAWETYAEEAETSLDDSRRIELALCRTSALVLKGNYASATATDMVLPVGPEGGVVAWVGTLYAQLL